jgi:hypothetical protein
MPKYSINHTICIVFRQLKHHCLPPPIPHLYPLSWQWRSLLKIFLNWKLNRIFTRNVPSLLFLTVWFFPVINRLKNDIIFNSADSQAAGAAAALATCLQSSLGPCGVRSIGGATLKVLKGPFTRRVLRGPSLGNTPCELYNRTSRILSKVTYTVVFIFH